MIQLQHLSKQIFLSFQKTTNTMPMVKTKLVAAIFLLCLSTLSSFSLFHLPTKHGHRFNHHRHSLIAKQHMTTRATTTETIPENDFAARAKKAGVRLEKFKSLKLDDDVLESLDKMVNRVDTFPFNPLISNHSYLVHDTDSIIKKNNNGNINNNDNSNVGITILPPTENVTTFQLLQRAQNASEHALKPSVAAYLSALLPREDEYLCSKRLEMLIQDMSRAYPDVYDTILDSFKDLYLTSNFIPMLQAKLKEDLPQEVRNLYGKIANRASEVVSEFAQLVHTESMSHLELICTVCTISVEHKHDEAAFFDHMNSLRRHFDSKLLSYINFAMKLEMAEMMSQPRVNGTIPNTTWMQILQVMYQVVFLEMEARFNRVLEPLTIVLRFQDTHLQSKLFQRFLKHVPAVDLPYVKGLALNVINSPLLKYNSSWDNTREQLQKDIDTYLSDDILFAKIDEIRHISSAQGQELQFYEPTYGISKFQRHEN